MEETRVFKLTRRPMCPFCNQRVDRDAEMEALVRAGRIVLRNTEEIYTTLPTSMRGALTGLVIALRPFENDSLV